MKRNEQSIQKLCDKGKVSEMGKKRKAKCIFLIFHCSTRSQTVENSNDHHELDAYSACGCGMLITMAGGRNWENEVLPHTGSSVILFLVDSHY